MEMILTLSALLAWGIVVTLWFALYTTRRQVSRLEHKLKERLDLEKFAIGGRKRWQESVYGRLNKHNKN
jgi:hypothetical protein